MTTAAAIDDSEQKAVYAALLLKERDPFKAALQLFPDNTSRALWVAHHWPNDEAVVAEKEKLMGAGADGVLPSKVELALDIWGRMQGTKLPNGVMIPPTPDEYSKLAKLYAEVRGFIEKPQTNVNLSNVLNIPRVVEMPVFASEKDWEAAAERQQRELLDNARTRH